MATGNFDKCYAHERVYEGGNDDDPRDPGGRTSRGVIQREYDVYLRAHGKWAIIADHDVWNASEADIRQIYLENYWQRAHCEDLPAGVDLVVFDGAVNSGLSQQAKWCQRATGATVDGDFGPETLHKLQTANDNDLLCEAILERRLAMLQSLKTWKYYGKGWSARVANVLKISQAWATGSVGPDPVSVSDLGGHRKADPADIAKPIIPVSAGQVAAGGSIVAGSATAATSQIQSVQSVLPEKWQTWAAVAVAGLGVVAAIATFVSTQAQKRADAANDASASVKIDKGADLAASPVKLAA